MTIEIFKAFWQKVSPHLEFPLTQAGDEASHVEWEDNGDMYQGMRKLGGARHGIVRTINPGGSIREATYCNDEMHGLSFFWGDYTAFTAAIYDHGQLKASIIWKDDWSEIDSDNKEMILENNVLCIFKP